MQVSNRQRTETMGLKEVEPISGGSVGNQAKQRPLPQRIRSQSASGKTSQCQSISERA
jgi:hypothetical protein